MSCVATYHLTHIDRPILLGFKSVPPVDITKRNSRIVMFRKKQKQADQSTCFI